MKTLLAPLALALALVSMAWVRLYDWLDKND